MGFPNPSIQTSNVATLQGSQFMVRLLIYTMTLYEWNTLLVCWITVRQMGHDGFFICVSRLAHASHTHTW